MPQKKFMKSRSLSSDNSATEAMEAEEALKVPQADRNPDSRVNVADEAFVIDTEFTHDSQVITVSKNSGLIFEDCYFEDAWLWLSLLLVNPTKLIVALFSTFSNNSYYFISNNNFYNQLS